MSSLQNPPLSKAKQPREDKWLVGLMEPPMQILSKPPAACKRVVSIRELECIGSYNWSNDEKPTIIVPGSPPVWRDRPVPYNVPPDKGWVYTDYNGYMMPSSTLLPLFRAVDAVSEESKLSIDWSSVDFVTDRNCLRCLLQWIRGSSGRDFRIDTQMVGEKTVLLNHWTIAKREKVNRNQSRSYGFSFERESTSPAPGCEGGTAHYRIIKYKLGDLSLIVRFEIDACLAPTTVTAVDGLGNLLSATGSPLGGPGGPCPEARKTSTAELDIIHAGSIVPHHSLIELETSRPKPAESYPQLFLSHTPYLYEGIHQKDTFTGIKKHHISDEKFQVSREFMEKDFVELADALRMIQSLLRQQGRDGRLSLVYQKKTLQVYKRASNQSCLPDAVLKRFGA